MYSLRFALLCLGITTVNVPAQNLILNGSFEDGSFVENSVYSGRMQVADGSTTINHWVVGSAAGNFWWLQSPHYNAQDGIRGVDLDSNLLLPASYIEQTFATTPGQKYQVSAYFSSEGNGGPAQTSILINGILTCSVSVGSGVGDPGPDYTNLVWTPWSFVFTASSASTTLRFEDATTLSYYNPIIDNVSVVAVPEPSVLGLGGLMLVGTIQRRLRNSRSNTNR